MPLLVLGEICSILQLKNPTFLGMQFPCQPLLIPPVVSASVFLAQQKASACEHLPNIAKPGHSWGCFSPLLYEDLNQGNATFPAFPVSIRDEESWMVLLRTLPFPSPGKYSIDSSNRAETSSLQHNRQTNNPHTIYHKSLDPVFESGSLYRVNTHESLLAPLIILTCCCSQLVWSLCLKSSTLV